MKAELDRKKGVLASMESELAKANHWNGQLVGPFHRCDMMLSKYTEEVSHLGDRWRRIDGQIDTRHVCSSSRLLQCHELLGLAACSQESSCVSITPGVAQNLNNAIKNC